MSTACIFYHKADLDGKLSGAIINTYLRSRKIETTLIPWDYHLTLGSFDRSRYDQIWIVDLSIPELLEYYDPKIIWIDHHISAIEAYSPKFDGLRINGVAAGRLCWAYLYGKLRPRDKEDFKFIEEPAFVRLAGEYDVFEEKETDYHFHLNFAVSHKSIGEITDLYLEHIHDFSSDDEIYDGCSLTSLIDDGEKILEYIYSVGERSAPLTVEVCGHRLIAINTNIKSSLIFNNLQTEGYYGMCVFNRVRSDRISLSFYSKSNDVLSIAKKLGGGGHKLACGATISVEQFYKEVKFI